MLFNIVALTLTLAFPISSFPFSNLLARQDGPGHSYECDPKYNAAARKQSLQNMGATTQDLAITILETSCDMSGTVYPYGDGKTADSANFGLFKNNWGNIRAHCSQFQGQSQDEWNNGKVLNTDDAAAITCQHEQIQAQGQDGFYQAQRGVAGQGPDYGQAVQFIESYLEQGHTSDDMVTYYNLHAV